MRLWKQFMIQPRNKKQLQEIIIALVQERTNYGDFNDIDTSLITDMSDLFNCHALRSFKGDISSWDTSNVTDMSGMFMDCSFNGDISSWNVSKVTNMMQMFENCLFNGDLSKWDVSNVKDMTLMFHDSSFKGYLEDWNINPDCDVCLMFSNNPCYDLDDGTELKKKSLKRQELQRNTFSFSQAETDLLFLGLQRMSEGNSCKEHCTFNKECAECEKRSQVTLCRLLQNKLTHKSC